MNARNVQSNLEKLEAINLDHLNSEPTHSSCKLIYNIMLIALFVMADLTKNKMMSFYDKQYIEKGGFSFIPLSSASIIELKYKYDGIFQESLHDSLSENAQNIRREIFLKSLYQNKFKNIVQSYSLVEKAKQNLYSIFSVDEAGAKVRIYEKLNEMVATLDKECKFLGNEKLQCICLK